MKKNVLILLLIAYVIAGCGVIPTYAIPATLDVNQLIAETANPALTKIAEDQALASTQAAAETMLQVESNPTVIVEIPIAEEARRGKDIALLLGTLSIGSDSALFPGEQFHVTWRIRNIGESVWDDAFSVVYAGGESFSQDDPIPLSAKVNPGDIIDLTLVLTAPEEVGTYHGEWMLMAPDGNVFGVGYDELKPLTVDINVIENPIASEYRMVYRFFDGYSTASWSDQFGTTFCSAEGNFGTHGSVTRKLDAVFEGGIEEDEPTIVMVPSQGEGGYIQGIFSSYIAGSGDYFSTRVGCLEDNHRCDVNLKILVLVVGEDEPEILWESNKTYDGEWIRIHTPLVKYADKEIQIIFRVENNGDSNGDVIGWFVPVIYR